MEIIRHFSQAVGRGLLGILTKNSLQREDMEEEILKVILPLWLHTQFFYASNVSCPLSVPPCGL